MRLVTVGTGTVVPDAQRASACHWVDEGDSSILLDCGAGALQGLARCNLAWAEIGHLVISHFHVDHIGEIPSLIFAMRHGVAQQRTTPLHIWGPAGTERLFHAWAAALGPWMLGPGFEITLHELEPRQSADLDGLSVDCAATPHTEESLALRIAAPGSILGYTGDTGPSEELGPFFRGTDLLLAECSLPDELALDLHLSPTSLARLANAAGVPRLVVTHVYPQLQVQDASALIRAAGFDGEIILAEDGLVLDL